MFYIGILASIFVSFIYWFKKNDLRAFFLFWYIVFLPTTKLLPDINIPGFRFENIFGISFLIVDYFVQNKNVKKQKIYYEQSKYVRIFLIMQASFLVYSFVKGIFFPSEDQYYSIIDFAIFSIRMSLIVYVFVRVCYLIQNINIKNVITYGLLVGLFLLGFSSFFYKFFAELGVTTGQLQYDEELKRNVIASAGLFRGHPTQFSAFLATGFGFAFSLLLSKKNRIMQMFSLIAIMSCILGIINSSKREGIVGVIIILLYYLFFEKQNISKKTIILFFILSMGIWAVFNFGDYLISRIGETQQQLSGITNNESRYAIWSSHILFFIEHQEIWPIGIWWRGSIKIGNLFITSHNTLLKYLIYAGVPFFFFYYKNIYNLFKYYFNNKKFMSLNYLYPLIGYLVPSVMNDNFDTNYLPFMLLLGMAASVDNKLNTIILVQKLNNEFKKDLELDQIS